MNTTKIQKKLQKLRESDYTLEEKFNFFLDVVGFTPNAKQILANIELVDPDMLRSPMFNTLTASQVVEKVKKQVQIKTVSSSMISVQVFGYDKLITPKDMDNWIDQVANNVQIQRGIELREKQLKEPVQDIEQRKINREQEIALDEMEEFY